MAFLKYQVVPQLNDKHCIVVRIKCLIVTSFEMGYEPSLFRNKVVMIFNQLDSLDLVF